MSASVEAGFSKVVVVGHVDHGKSTLLGRILLACGKVPTDRIAHVEKICQDKSVQFEPAFLFDALQEEQEQGISIDTTRVYFEYEGHKFILIDAPGHLEFLKNMTSGASEADLGVLVVDCQQGVRSQTERHLKILSMLNVRHVIVALNKVDQINYDQFQFEQLCQRTREIIEQQDICCEEIVPICALAGENIISSTNKLSWYVGKPFLPTLIDVASKRASAQKESSPFRMLLQDVYRFTTERHFAGRIASGQISTGQEVFFSPSGKVSRIEAIEKLGVPDCGTAYAGESVALKLSEQIFVERGEVLSLVDNAPEVDNEFRARLAWFSLEPFKKDQEYLLKIGTAETMCTVELLQDAEQKTVESELDLCNGAFAEAIIRAKKPVAFDRATTGGVVGNFVICSTFETVAAGVVDNRPVHTQRNLKINPNLRLEQGYAERAKFETLNGHGGTVLWMTGLSGAGKSSLARELEHTLFKRNSRVVVLDGDNLRFGLCADLGFSPEERSENIRRIAHTARLFLDTGFIVISACISPFARDRELAREIVGASDFNEIFVFCPLEECQRRDPKGLYSKASAGQIKAVTGFDSPYQSPQKPDLRLDSSKLTVSQEVEAIVSLLEQKNVLPAKSTLGSVVGSVASNTDARVLSNAHTDG